MKLCFEELGHRNLIAKMALYLVEFCHNTVLKNSHIIQFPLANVARMCENLLVSELLNVNELVQL